MKKIVVIIILLWSSITFVFSQKIEKNDVKNPLDFAVYLLKLENRLWMRETELTWISENYWKSGKKQEALEILDLFDEDEPENKIKLLSDLSDDLLKRGKNIEAAELLDKVFEFKEGIVDLDISVQKTLALNLVLANKEDKAFELVRLLEFDFEKAICLLEISTALRQKGDWTKALEVLKDSIKFVEQSNSERNKHIIIAEVGRQYIELGELTTGLELLDSSKEFAKIDWDVYTSLVEGYSKAGQSDEAFEVVNNYKEFIQSQVALESAEICFKVGDKEQSLNFLREAANYETEIISAKNKSYHNEFMLKVVKLYLKWNEPYLALQTVKTIDNENPKQFSFIEISKYFQNRRNNKLALKILNFAFESAKKIKKNDDDRNQMIKDDYLANLADEAIDLDNFEFAEIIVRSTEKKFYRGGGLAVLVMKNKSLSPKSKLILLKEANILFQRDKSNHRPIDKIRLWSILAYDYSKIGLQAEAQQVFSEILTYIASNKEIDGLEVILNLSTAGYWFEKSQINNDERINNSLQKVTAKWHRDVLN